MIAILVAPLLVACGSAAAQPEPGAAGGSPPGLKVITSAGDPSDPVPFRWTTHRSQRPDGHRLLLQGGTLHSIADSVRLVDLSGRVLATAPTTSVSGPTGACPGGGVVRAEAPIPESTLAAFLGDWPTGYRVEVRVGGRWRPAALTFAGCRSGRVAGP